MVILQRLRMQGFRSCDGLGCWVRGALKDKVCRERFSEKGLGWFGWAWRYSYRCVWNTESYESEGLCFRTVIRLRVWKGVTLQWIKEAEF